MSSNGIVKGKMLKNWYQWERNSITFYNQISAETKWEIRQVEKEILLVKIVKAIRIVKVRTNSEQTNTIYKIRM